MRNDLLGERKKHMMGGGRQKSGKTGCEALECHANEVDYFLWAKQTCVYSEGHVLSHFTRKTGDVIQVMNI